MRTKINMNIKTLVYLFGLLIVPFSTFATSTITIKNGSELLISGGELKLDCEEIEVILNSGGTLRVTGGLVTDLNLTRKSGSVYQASGGKVITCDSFYIIITPDGKAAVINL